MSKTSTRSHRVASGLAVGGLLLIPLAACSGTDANTGSSVLSSASSAAGAASSAASSAAGAASSAASSAAGAASSAANSVTQQAGNAADCSGSSCSVTLTDNGSPVSVLGTTISLGGVQNGQATLGVGDNTVSCGQGDNVSAGPLTLECTTVSQNSVTLTASLG